MTARTALRSAKVVFAVLVLLLSWDLLQFAESSAGYGPGMDGGAPTEGLNDQPDEPLHRGLTRDPAEPGGGAVEDDAGYERAVEEDTVAPPVQEQDPGADELAPEFREPDQAP